MPVVWEVFSDYLFITQKAYNLEIQSFILMNNHFHMLVRTPDSNLDRAMNYFLRESSKEIGRLSNRINQIFGGPYHRCLIKSEAHHHNVYKYIYQNPVRAGVCRRVEEYPFSTLRNILGLQRSIIPVSGDLYLSENPFETLNWLNQKLEANEVESLRKGLRKGEFQLSQDKNSGKLIELPSTSYD